MKEYLQNLKENGAVAAIGAVGLVALAGMFAQRGGMNAHMPSQGSAFYHSPKKGSSKRRGGRNAYSKFVGGRVKELHSQGYAPTEAMKVAAKEWRNR